MIKLDQFSSEKNSTIILAGKIGAHLKNQNGEKLTALSKRFANPELGGNREIFTEALIALYILGRIDFSSETDRIEYHEN